MSTCISGHRTPRAQAIALWTWWSAAERVLTPPRVMAPREVRPGLQSRGCRPLTLGPGVHHCPPRGPKSNRARPPRGRRSGPCRSGPTEASARSPEHML